jgi:hypothetical protein
MHGGIAVLSVCVSAASNSAETASVEYFRNSAPYCRQVSGGSWTSLRSAKNHSSVGLRMTCQVRGLGFPILGDHGGEIGARFGLRWTLPDYLRVAHTTLGAVLPQFNGEDSWTLPMNARYVIAQDGKIAYAEVNADYTRRPEPSAIFPVLERLRQRQVA